MKTFQQYKQQRMSRNPEFWKGYQERFELFELGVLLKQARQETRERPAEFGNLCHHN